MELVRRDDADLVLMLTADVDDVDDKDGAVDVVNHNDDVVEEDHVTEEGESA